MDKTYATAIVVDSKLLGWNLHPEVDHFLPQISTEDSRLQAPAQATALFCAGEQADIEDLLSLYPLHEDFEGQAPVGRNGDWEEVETTTYTFTSTFWQKVDRAA